MPFYPSVAARTIAKSGQENSDAIAYSRLSPESMALVIADGVGSAKHGGDAARLAVNTCIENAGKLDLPSIFKEVSKVLREAAGSELNQWSTTLTICIVHDHLTSVGHVGDTRVYHLRGSGLQSRTQDQTEVAHLIRDGVLTPERARRYSRKNVLLSAVNGNGDYELQLSEFAINDGDRLLLLSDGFYGQMSKSEIVGISQKHVQLENFLEEMTALLLNRGIVDDASALGAEIKFQSNLTP